MDPKQILPPSPEELAAMAFRIQRLESITRWALLLGLVNILLKLFLPFGVYPFLQ